MTDPTMTAQQAEALEILDTLHAASKADREIIIDGKTITVKYEAIEQKIDIWQDGSIMWGD